MTAPAQMTDNGPMSASALLLMLSLAAEPDAKSAARALVKATGCKQVTHCQVMPMGSRPCGGPSEFLVYCSKTTDLKKLKAKVKTVTDGEKATNATEGLMGTCQVLTPPKVKLENGACVVDAPTTGEIPI